MLFYFALTSILVFCFGYYLGNQMGRTQHVRDHLRRLRDERSVQSFSSIESGR